MSSELTANRVQRINTLHAEIGQHLRMTLDKAIEIGEILTAQKAELEHGEWLPWIKASLPFSERLVRDYIRFYEHREELKSANVADLTEARRLLAGPSTQPNDGPRQGDTQNPLVGLMGHADKIEVSERGLRVREGQVLTPSEWDDLKNRAAYVKDTDAGQWIIGDLLAYRDTMRQAVCEIESATLAIARELSTAKRALPQDGHTWSEYLEDARLTEQEAEQFLSIYNAETDSLTENWGDTVSSIPLERMPSDVEEVGAS